MLVKRFPDAEAAHGFLNSQPDNKWALTKPGEPTKPGRYAYAGGQWHNVKTLDASVLAHV